MGDCLGLLALPLFAGPHVVEVDALECFTESRCEDPNSREDDDVDPLNRGGTREDEFVVALEEDCSRYIFHINVRRTTTTWHTR